MRKILISTTLLLAAALSATAAHALDASETPGCRDPACLAHRDGVRPADHAASEKRAGPGSSCEIAPGATLPVHKHPFPRYAYVEGGTLQVTNVETGKSTTYKSGDFIIEMIGQWHQATNVGADPVKLLVIDQVEEGIKNTVLRQ